MGRRKAPENSGANDSTETRIKTEAKADITPIATREVIKVNNANLTELKHTLDDALKRFLGSPDQFRTIHLHTDVRLALGWAGVFIAAGTALYGYKTEFEESKRVVATGLIIYILLTSIQTLYSYFIEGNIVYVGKRKTFAKRIESERITVESRTQPSSPTSPPKYELSISYVRSSNSGKSLLHRGKEHDIRGYNAFVDEEGTLDQDAFENWLRELVGRVMGDSDAK